MKNLRELSERLNADCPKHKFEVVRKWSLRSGRRLKIKVDGKLAPHFATREKVFKIEGVLQKIHNIDPIKEFSHMALLELQMEGIVEATDPIAISFREEVNKGIYKDYSKEK
jgi:hypothetical protein